ncbi:MAG: hypothetical protein QM599_04330 [Pseudoxanthomonas sp.]
MPAIANATQKQLGPGTEGLAYQIIDSDDCGGGGCRITLLRRCHGQWRTILDDGYGDDVTPLQTRHHGWLDVQVRTRQAANLSLTTEYHFDGETYRPATCVQTSIGGDESMPRQVPCSD